MAAIKQLQGSWINTVVKDESIVAPIEPTITSSLSYVQPIFSSKGKENKLKEFNSNSKVMTEYGNDLGDIAKFGQGGANVMQAISGGASVFTCRLLPTNATNSELILSVAVKTDTIKQYERIENEGAFLLDENGNKREKVGQDANGAYIQVRTYDSEYLSQQSSNSISSAIITIDGWEIYPLFKLTSKYAGKCGNDFGFNISIDEERDGKVTDGRRYLLSITEKNEYGDINNILSEEYLYFSFNPDSEFFKESGIYEGLRTVYNNKDANNPVHMEVFEENYYALIKTLSPFKEFGTNNDIDFIFGKNSNGFEYNKIVVDESDLHTDFETVTKFLTGGNDGSLQLGVQVTDPNNNDATITVDEQHIRITKEQLLKDFYSFKIDSSLLDDRIVDCTIALDANYPLEVKKIMVSTLVQYRKDIVVIADCNINNMNDAINIANSLSLSIDSGNSYNIVIAPQSGSRKNIKNPEKVTSTYEIARGLSEAYSRFGKFCVYAGFRKGEVKYVDFDWLPMKTIYRTEIEKLQQLSLLFATIVTKNNRVVWMSDDNKYSEKFSKLKSMRNGIIIGEAIRTASRILIKYPFEDSDINTILENAKTEIDVALTNNIPDTINAISNLYQTVRDKQTDNTSCELIFTFPDVPQKFSVTIKARRGGTN